MAPTPGPDAELPPPQAPPAAPRRDLSGQFCPNCGAPLTADEGTTCKFCGENLMPYFAPQVARASKRGAEKGVLYAGLGCVALVALSLVALVGLIVVAVIRQGSSAENGYSCSPGPCASPSGSLSLRVVRVAFGDLPQPQRAAAEGGSQYMRLLITMTVSANAEPVVRATDFGLLDRGGNARPVVSGFPPCQAWDQLTPTGTDAPIPAVCFAVNDPDVGHYRMTWTRLKPGQTIRLYMPVPPE